MDLEFADLIDYFREDKKTESIILYIESIKKPVEFMKAARAFTREKPIFALKAGRFEEGIQAAASHTGALAGSNKIYNLALERAGIVRVQKVEDLINVAQSLSMQKMPENNRLCILTNAGGPGVIATDALIERGGSLAEISPQSRQALNDNLPAFWSHGNPVDILGDARASRYEKAIEICLKDPNNDGLMIIFTPQAMSEPVATARAVARLSKRYQKPIFTSWMGAEYVEDATRLLLNNGIPSYTTPEPAIDAFTLMFKSRQLNYALKQLEKNTDFIQPSAKISHTYQNLIQTLKTEGKRTFLNEIETKSLLEEYQIPTSGTKLAHSPSQASSLAEQIGFPVVLKVQSPQILHKTEAGGVILNLGNKLAVHKAYEEILYNAQVYNPEAVIEGITVQKMIDPAAGFELLLGLKKDPIWGSVLVIGAGGTNVELSQDTVASLLPTNKNFLEAQIQETKIYQLLKGYRGQKGVDLNYLMNILQNFAQLVTDFPEIQELDINPLLIKENSAYALDARVIF